MFGQVLSHRTQGEGAVRVILNVSSDVDGGVPEVGRAVVCNPVPAAAEITAPVMRPLVERAMQDCEALGVRGKQVTPAVLERILALTEGRSMETNIALVENNAKLAAEIAIAFAASS